MGRDSLHPVSYTHLDVYKRQFLDLGQCLDYAIAHGPESHVPILMSDPIGMLWVAECVLHGDDAGYLVILGPVFDAAASWQTLQNCLRGMNLSVSLTATIMEKLEQVPILPLSTLHQYIKMLHCCLLYTSPVVQDAFQP